MLSLQELVEIAARYFTAMADAMLAACVAKALEAGEPLAMPPRAKAPGGMRQEPILRGDVDWDLMVRSNTDTRWMHQ